MQRKCLIIGPAWVGDMVMSQPLFAFLKRTDPKMHISVLAPRWTFPLLHRMPQIDDAVVMPLTHGELGFKKRYEIGKKLRTQQFTQAIILPNSWKSALIPFFAKIPIRTGWRGECRYGLLTDLRILETSKYIKMVDRFLALGLPKNDFLEIQQFNDTYPKLTVEKTSVEKTRHAFGLNLEKPILALCPGAEFGQAKRWPQQHYAEIAKQALAQGFQVWLLGSENDVPIGRDIQKHVTQVSNLIGQTNLAQAIDLLSLVDKVLTNDSGLMHIACSVGCKVVALFGPTPTAFTPPLSDNAKIVSENLACMPCRKRVCPLGHQNCMQGLLPEKVLKEIELRV